MEQSKILDRILDFIKMEPGKHRDKAIEAFRLEVNPPAVEESEEAEAAEGSEDE